MLLYQFWLNVTWQALALGGFACGRPMKGNVILRCTAAAGGILLFSALLAFAGAGLFSALDGTAAWGGMVIAYSSASQVLLLGAYCAITCYTMEVQPIQAVYLVIYAFLSECVSSYVYEFLVQATPMVSVLPLYPIKPAASYVLYVLVKAAAIAGLYLLVGRRLSALQRQYERTRGDGVNQYILALLGLIILSNVIVYNTVFTITDDMKVVRLGLMLICLVMCVLAYLFMLALFNAVLYKVRESTVEQLRQSEREQFRITRENIEIINRKCHDLKHQIHTILSAGGAGTDSFVRELEAAVSIYDSSIRTGNQYIDVILSDKSLHCQENGIEILAMIDGSAFAFIDKYDLNSIFGNLLDNAIEYLKTISQPDKRFIRIVGRSDEFGVMLTVENYLEEIPNFDENKRFPKTTKTDTVYHGFGLRNVSNIVEGYDGVMTVDTSDSLFAVKIMFMAA